MQCQADFKKMAMLAEHGFKVMSLKATLFCRHTKRHTQTGLHRCHAVTPSLVYRMLWPCASHGHKALGAHAALRRPRSLHRPQGCCSDSCSRLLWSSPWRTRLALHVRRCKRRQLLQHCDTNHRALSLNSCWSHVGRASRALQDMRREANVRGAGRAVCWLEQTYCPCVKGQRADPRCSGHLLVCTSLQSRTHRLAVKCLDRPV